MNTIQQFVIPKGMLRAVNERREELSDGLHVQLTDEQIIEPALRWLIANPLAVYDLIREWKRA